MSNQIPSYIKPYLWSYDTKSIDLTKDRELIITKVLNHGTQQAIQWLFSVYPRQEIAETIAVPKPGQWNPKSLNYWALIFNITPRVTARHVT